MFGTIYQRGQKQALYLYIVLVQSGSVKRLLFRLLLRLHFICHLDGSLDDSFM